MNQYKFRGKRKDNGEWVYGSLSIEYDGSCFISFWVSECTDASVNLWEPVQKWHEVLPTTIGQFTNHEEGFYVGDIVNYVTGNPKQYVNAVVEFGEYDTYTHFNKEEGDVESHIGFYINDGEGKFPIRSLWIEKVGNIHDNPELVNPTSGKASINNMLDPNTQQAANEEVKAEGQEIAAVEQEAQEKALDSEEGSTEG